MDANILLLDVFDDSSTPAEACGTRLYRPGRQECTVAAPQTAK
jgi:hypothetical protein